MTSYDEWPLNIDVEVFSQPNSQQSTYSSPFSTHNISPNDPWLQEKLEETDQLRRSSWSDMKNIVNSVLEFMGSKNVNLPLFLDAISWGSSDCRDDTVISHAKNK